MISQPSAISRIKPAIHFAKNENKEEDGANGTKGRCPEAILASNKLLGFGPVRRIRVLTLQRIRRVSFRCWHFQFYSAKMSLMLELMFGLLNWGLLLGVLFLFIWFHCNSSLTRFVVWIPERQLYLGDVCTVSCSTTWLFIWSTDWKVKLFVYLTDLFVSVLRNTKMNE